MTKDGQSAAAMIDARIAELGDWRGTTLARVRALIHAADPGVVETWKWRGVPVWEHDGIVCTGETYRETVKLTFHRGAALADPSGLFNASLEGNARRAIDIHEGERINERAFKALIREAVRLNVATAAAKAPKSAAGKAASSTSATRAKTTSAAQKPVLLSGGNPQIAKGDGDAPVQAYIAAMPGWKRDAGRRLDALITRSVPGVRKAIRWNSPFYGVEGQGWFASFHVFARYIKVTFFAGAALRPEPPGRGKDPEARWFDIHEGELDERQMAAWMKQAAATRGWSGR